MRGSRSRGNFFLREVKLVASLAYMSGDPIPLAQLADRRVLITRLSVSLAMPRTIPCRFANGSALRANVAILFRAHDG